MPKRSTFVGGPPQFGQFRATGPCWPAGTIGCWIGGGGGIVRRPAPDATAMMMKTMTKRNGMQMKGATEKTDPGLPMKTEPIARKNTTWAISNIGALGSVLIATIKPASFMPATCCIAPLIPQATYSFGWTVLPL